MSNAMLSQNLKNLKISRKFRISHYLIYLGLLLLTIWSLHSTVIVNTDWDRMGTLADLWKSVGMFFPVDWYLFTLLPIPILETLMIATLGTGIAVILSVPVAWFAARNTSPFFPVTYPIGRGIMTLTRSVHEIVWGLIFVTAVGLGAFPGILAVAMRSIGFISKLTAEAIEDIDHGPVEAIQAAGGNRIQVVVFAIFPQILPVFIGNVIFQWDINIRRASILGLVGAGGLGLVLYNQQVLYNYQGITTVILAILVLVLFGEVISYYARKKVI